jgi:hypothetical protein
MAKELFNFANLQMCKYARIFPTTVELLEHLLFVIGNGYDYDISTGLIVDGRDCAISNQPPLSARDWEKLIKDCIDQEISFLKSFRQGAKYSPEEVEKRSKDYYIRSTSASEFTEDYFLARLRDRAKALTGSRRGETHVRHYPLFKNYSIIYQIDKKSPEWLIKLSLDYTSAWKTFIKEELDSENFSDDADTDGRATKSATEDSYRCLDELVNKLKKLLEQKSRIIN